MPSSPPRPLIRTLNATDTWFSWPTAAAAKALVQSRPAISVATCASTTPGERSAKKTATVKNTKAATPTSWPWRGPPPSASEFSTPLPRRRTPTPRHRRARPGGGARRPPVGGGVGAQPEGGEAPRQVHAEVLALALRGKRLAQQ